MRKLIYLLIGIFLVSSVSAISWSGGTVNIINQTINQTLVLSNVTNFTQLEDSPNVYAGSGGLCVKVNAGETEVVFEACGAGGGGDFTFKDFQNSFNLNFSATGLNYNQTDTVFFYNQTESPFFYNMTIAGVGGNTSWNQTFADTLYANIIWSYNQTDTIFFYNQTESPLFYNQTDTIFFYNQTDTVFFYNQTQSPFFYNMTISDGSGGNTSWNQTYADTLYAGIEWDYNQTVAGSSGASARYINYTNTTTTGNITSGAFVGYKAGSDLCEKEVASGSHMCTMDELLIVMNEGDYSNFTTVMRVSEGAPGFLANAGDCEGWKDDDNTFLGSIWVGNTDNGGKGSQVSCGAERAIACCI